MKKKLISLLLALTMVLSLFVPAMAIGDPLPAAEGGIITLDKDYELDGYAFESTVKINLAGHMLTGTATGTDKVTVENLAKPVYVLDEKGQPTETVDYYEDTPACLLGVEGTFANDVSNYVADGYDVKSEGKEVFNNEANSKFKVVVDVQPATGGTDYDSSNDFPDVYADEYVTVTVKVTGARYASADFTLTWDNNLFVDETMSWDLTPGWEGHGKDAYDGFTSYRFTGAHEKVEGKPQEEYFKDGEVIGTFTMRALYIDESIVKSQSYSSKAAVIEASDRGSYNVFTVKSSGETETAKVIGSWRKAKLDSTTTPLTADQLNDGVAHIILMDAMTGDVSAKTGLSYKAQGQNLLDTTYNNNNTGFSALVGGKAPVGNNGEFSAKVVTTVMTKAAYDALADKTNINYTGKTIDNKLTVNDIQAINAGDYVVCYKISAPGYASVTGVKNVNIAKQKVDLVWSAPTYNEEVAGSKTFTTGSGDDNAYNYVGEYDTVGFNAPTATFTDLNNGTVNVSSTWTSGPNADESLKDVGVYGFEADPSDNYEFNNPTVSVKVKGLTITGWTLEATNWKNTKDANGVAKEDNGVIWRDGESRPIGSLDVADTASFAKGDGKYYENANFTGEVSDTEQEGYHLKDATKYYTPGGVEVTNVHVTYEWSEGKYYTTEEAAQAAGKNVGDEIWTPIDATNAKTVADLGTYKLRMTVTADNYEKLEQTVTFQIKNPIFVMENLEYVAGYSIVLVYTNETGVSFKYGSGGNAIKMYDVTKFGYKYNNNNYGNGSASYAHVYAIVVKGAADTSLVYASNEAAEQLKLDAAYSNMMPSGTGYKGNKYVNDVNNKGEINGGKDAVVELDDITAIQSIYNVNANNMKDMQVVLRADVNRDKMVDVNGDVAQALAFYLNPTA